MRNRLSTGTSVYSAQSPLIQRHRARNHSLYPEVLLVDSSTCVTSALAFTGIANCSCDCLRKCWWIIDRDQPTVLAIMHYFREPANSRRDNWHARSTCFYGHVRQAFV